MKEFIEKLIGRLSEEIKKINDEPWLDCEERIKKQCIYCNTIKIINELAEEHNGGWIPCSERLPENEDYVLCWYEYYRFGSYNRMYQTYGLGYYIKQYDMWGGEVNQGQKCRVIAWQLVPAPYNPKGE